MRSRAYSPIADTIKKGRHSRPVKTALDVAKTRLWMACFTFSFCLLAVFVRLAGLTLFHQESEPVMAAADYSGGVITGRADIMDRNGQLLATTIMTSSLYANAKKIQDPHQAAQKLHTLFPEVSIDTLKTRLMSGKSFVWIARHLTPKMQSQVLDLGIPGLDFVLDTRRVYPQKNLVSHVVGFTDIDNQGVAGIESYFDQQLRSQTDPISLSLDIRMQHAVRDELLKGIEEFMCLGANATVIDLDTGEIVAMVSLPDFDPNRPRDSPSEALFNRNTLGAYELGSIMKIANTAMGLESQTVSLGTTYNTSLPLKVGRFSITDYRADHGVINVAQIFVHSSNKGSARIALDVGAEKQKAFLERLGFLEKAKIELPEVGSPIVPKRWREARVITISYGYGLSVSPLQALTGITSIAAGGRRFNPTLLKRERGENPYGERLISEQNSRRLLQLMRFVVTEGTSRKSDVPGYFVAGKTGTADLLIGGRYDKSRSSTTFVGVFGETGEKPKYGLIVRLDDPKRLKKTYGFNAAGWNAAPVAGNIIRRLVGIAGLRPQEEGTKVLDPFFRHVSFRKKS